MNIDLKEFPQVQGAAQTKGENKQAKQKITSVKFGTTRDKFLQFSKDMRGALALLEA